MKRLICCLDGTWNSDDADAVPTNVVKLHRAVLPVDANGIRQVSHYVQGIASAKDTRAQFLKGAVGYEVADRIQNGYRFLADTYEPGDEIFLFGFSRGAFEARSLAGFITLFGIAKKEAGFSVADAWAVYSQSLAKRSAADLDRLRAAAHYPVRIKCVGVWDTVGNIGNPFFSGGLLSRWSKFHDTRLHPSIEVGLHALSVDELRGPFRPSLWTRPRNAAPTPGQHIEQVWFAGSHANVGGGFPETELSDIALLWMAERANSTAGLAVDIDALLRAARPNPLGLQHASATGSLFKWSGRVPFIRLVNQRVQAIPRLRRTLIGSWRSSKLARSDVAINESVHESVLARFGKSVNEATGDTLAEIVYRPRNIAALIDARQGSAGEATSMTNAATGQNTAEQTSSPRTRLVTVHGTGAGHKECSGERWWQRGSPFLAELSKRLNLDPGRVEIVPFHWELGPNSETGRRAASQALFAKLNSYDKEGVDYHVIGHSHGGSVIYDALLHSVAKGKPFERLKSWCTIGTPFLDYRANRFLFSRLGTKGLTLYAMALGILIFGAGLLFNYFAGGTQIEGTSEEMRHFFTSLVLPLALVALGFGGACMAFLYAVERIRGGTHNQARKKKTADLYKDRWIGLWHRDDEAISALTNVQHVKGAIIPSTFLTPFVAIAQVVATVALSVALVVYALPGLWAFMVTSWPQIAQTDSGDSSALGYAMTIVSAIGVLAIIAAVYVGVASLIVAILKLVARGVGWPLAKAIDNLVWSSIRQQAWGDDRQGEGVAQVGSHPPEFAATFGSLPAAIADEVSRFSEKHAILTLTKVREVLGMTSTPQKSPDMRAQLSEQLNWRELIHTTYFDIPEFADLAAFGLHRAGLAPLKEDFWPSDRRERAQAWYQAIASARSGEPATAAVG